MTREEAITLIKSAQLMLINPTTNEPVSDLYMALDMAIRILENHDEFMKRAYEQGKKDALSVTTTSSDEIKTVYYPQVDGITPTIVAQEPPDAVGRASVIKFEGTNMACMGGDEIMKEFENNIQQPCDDAISREAVLQAITKHMDGEDKNCKLQLSSVVEWIRDLPNVKPQYKECRTLDEFIKEQTE